MTKLIVVGTGMAKHMSVALLSTRVRIMENTREQTNFEFKPSFNLNECHIPKEKDNRPYFRRFNRKKYG